MINFIDNLRTGLKNENGWTFKKNNEEMKLEYQNTIFSAHEETNGDSYKPRLNFVWHDVHVQFTRNDFENANGFQIQCTHS